MRGIKGLVFLESIKENTKWDREGDRGEEAWNWECYPINFSVSSAPPCFRVKIRVQILV